MTITRKTPLALLLASTTALRRVAIVTGGTRGVGLGISRRWQKHDFDLLLTYNSTTAAAEQAASELKNQFPICAIETVGGDVSLPEDAPAEDLGQVRRATVRQDARLGAVVHNAGQYVGVSSDNAAGIKATGPPPALAMGSLDADGKRRFTQMHYYQKMYGDAFVDLCERGRRASRTAVRSSASPRRAARCSTTPTSGTTCPAAASASWSTPCGCLPCVAAVAEGEQANVGVPAERPACPHRYTTPPPRLDEKRQRAVADSARQARRKFAATMAFASRRRLAAAASTPARRGRRTSPSSARRLGERRARARAGATACRRWRSSTKRSKWSAGALRASRRALVQIGSSPIAATASRARRRQPMRRRPPCAPSASSVLARREAQRAGRFG